MYVSVCPKQVHEYGPRAMALYRWLYVRLFFSIFCLFCFFYRIYNGCFMQLVLFNSVEFTSKIKCSQMQLIFPLISKWILIFFVRLEFETNFIWLFFWVEFEMLRNVVGLNGNLCGFDQKIARSA